MLMSVCAFLLVALVVWALTSLAVRFYVETGSFCTYDTDEYIFGATMQSVVPLAGGVVAALSMCRGETVMGTILMSAMFCAIAAMASYFCLLIIIVMFGNLVGELGYSLKSFYELPDTLVRLISRQFARKVPQEDAVEALGSGEQ